MSFESLSARIAAVLQSGPATESALLGNLGMQMLSWEILHTTLLRMLREDRIVRIGLLVWQNKGWQRPPCADKKCLKCGDVKPPDQFHNNRVRPDGKQSWCKRCQILAMRVVARRKRRQARAPRRIIEESQHVG